MPNPWMPGLVHDPGRSAASNNNGQYPEGASAMEFVVHHSTAGSNSYEICKWGRDGYDAGLCQILLPKNGVPWQFCEINSVCYHAGSSTYGDYNRRGPGIEVERLGPGQVGLTAWQELTDDQAHWLGEINRWLASEWGIPNVQYRGPQFPWWGAAFRGHVSHWDIHPNSDGLSVAEWDRINSTPIPKPATHPLLLLLEDTMHFETDPTDRSAIWRFDGNTRKHLTPDEWNIEKVKYGLTFVAAGLPRAELKPFTGTPATFANTPDIMTLVNAPIA